MLHVPDIGMAPPFYLSLFLVHRPAECIIHLLMDTVFILVPDKVRYIVDGGVQKVAGLPEVFPSLVSLLPPQESEPKLSVRSRKHPYVFSVPAAVLQKPQPLPVNKQNKLCIRRLVLYQRIQSFLYFHLLQIHENRPGLSCQRPVGPAAF